MATDQSVTTVDAQILRIDNAMNDTDRIAAEADLVELRHRAASDAIEHASAPSKTNFDGTLVGVERGFPLVADGAYLSGQLLNAAMDDCGCVHIPAMLPSDRVDGFVDGIDQAFEGYDKWAEEPDAEFGPWFRPYIPSGTLVQVTRPWLRNGGGLFTADSPRIQKRWFGLLHELGIIEAVANFFGETPVTSFDKCALRRVRHGDGIEWHQDGEFLGLETGAINLWVSLSDTSDAPGLEFVPRRLDDLVETGTQGANYEWTAGSGVVASLSSETGLARPHFGPGDGLFFDGRVLHRTEQRDPPTTGVRYAIETWFFRPSRFPAQQELAMTL